MTSTPKLLALAVFACASLLVNAGGSLATSRAEDTPPPAVEIVYSAPSGCEKLGEVSGTHFDASPRPKSAEESAMREARNMGATHVVQDSGKTHMTGAYEWTWVGMAYRCKATAAAPAK